MVEELSVLTQKFEDNNKLRLTTKVYRVRKKNVLYMHDRVRKTYFV